MANELKKWIVNEYIKYNNNSTNNKMKYQI